MRILGFLFCTNSDSVRSDLRQRMVRGIASGKSRRAVAAQFEVAPSTAVRLQARFAATGSVDPAKQGRPKGSGKLGPYREAILDKVKAQPDITMPDLAVWLETEHGVTADPSNPIQAFVPARVHL